MSQLDLPLDSYDVFDDFSLLPPGEYPATIIASEIRESRAGDRSLSLTYRIDDGRYHGRRVFDDLRLWHSNQTVREIAARALKTIATVSGHPNPNYIGNSEELHGRQLILKLSIRKDKNDPTKEYQDIKYAKASQMPDARAPWQDAPRSPAPQSAPTAQPAQPTARMPWEM